MSFLRRPQHFVLAFLFVGYSTGCSTFTSGSRAPAAVGSMSSLKVMDISDFRGNTYFNFVTSEKGLKHALLDPEFTRNFLPANPANLHQAAENFDPSVYHKILSQFAQQELGLDQLDEELTHQKNVNPSNLSKVVGKILESKGLPTNPQKIIEEAAIVSPFLGLASGSGASIIINRDNYFYSYGFKTGNSKSGKNFSVSPGHKALDANDSFYLSELETLMLDKNEFRDFFHSLLLTLVQCDSSEHVRLSVPSQTALTDFLSIYTAELSRHGDSNRRGSENDLAEITFLSSFSAKTGLVPGKKSLYRGHQQQLSFLAKNGEDARLQRRVLQMALHQSLQKIHPELITKVEAIVGPSLDSDLIHTVMAFLNMPANQERVKNNAKALVDAMGDYLTALHDESDAIAAAGIQEKYAKLILKTRILKN